MIENIRFWLEFSALSLFNLFFLLGIILIIIGITSILAIRKKIAELSDHLQSRTDRLLDVAQGAAQNLSDASGGLAGLLTPIFGRKRRSIWDMLFDYFRSK